MADLLVVLGIGAFLLASLGLVAICDRLRVS